MRHPIVIHEQQWRKRNNQSQLCLQYFTPYFSAACSNIYKKPLSGDAKYLNKDYNTQHDKMFLVV